ncbi:MAG: hypothetical protein ACLU38_08940 [Dysosmobacter sp.]
MPPRKRELESYKKRSSRPSTGLAVSEQIFSVEMIEETRNKLLDLAQELEQAKAKAADLESSAVAIQKEYDKIMTWADLYAGSSIEGKKMILRQLIDRVNIGKNFEIEVGAQHQCDTVLRLPASRRGQECVLSRFLSV